MNIVDKIIGYFDPEAAEKRVRSRLLIESINKKRNYSAATNSRRRSPGRRIFNKSPNSFDSDIATLRNLSRDMVRNNFYAFTALDQLTCSVIGWGIEPNFNNEQAQGLWKKWTKKADALGSHTFEGLQSQVFRSVLESGECFVRKVIVPSKEGIEPSFQLLVLESDFLDTSVENDTTIQGTRVDSNGKPQGYWLFDRHPADEETESRFYPTSEVIHVFMARRPGQLRGVPILSSIMLPLNDLTEMREARLMSAKIASCFAAFIKKDPTTDISLGATEQEEPELIEKLEPGLIQELSDGQDIRFAQPPQISQDSDFTREILRGVASVVGLTYEQLTGDYSGVNYSSARMAHNVHLSRRYDYLWGLMIPQFCEKVSHWFLDLGSRMGYIRGDIEAMEAAIEWVPAAVQSVDPERESRADKQQIRNGSMTLSQMIRSKGFDPEEFLKSYAKDLERLDELGIILDTDCRQQSLAGQKQHETDISDPDEE